MADDLNRTVHCRAPKTSDIEIHTSTIATDYGDFVEIREFIKSLDQYGRGITFPKTPAIILSVELGLDQVKDPGI